VALGGHIVSVSDEFFAEAYHLLKVEVSLYPNHISFYQLPYRVALPPQPAPSLKGQFGPKGALFSGWESRRHNPTYDWCIIKLGAPGQIIGFDIDTSHFSGNEAPQASVEALFSADDVPTSTDKRVSACLRDASNGTNFSSSGKVDRNITESQPWTQFQASFLY
jgi:allantoicase